MAERYVHVRFPQGSKYWKANYCPRVGEYIEYEGEEFRVTRILHRQETNEVEIFLEEA